MSRCEDRLAELNAAKDAYFAAEEVFYEVWGDSLITCIGAEVACVMAFGAGPGAAAVCTIAALACVEQFHDTYQAFEKSEAAYEAHLEAQEVYRNCLDCTYPVLASTEESEEDEEIDEPVWEEIEGYDTAEEYADYDEEDFEFEDVA